MRLPREIAGFDSASVMAGRCSGSFTAEARRRWATPAFNAMRPVAAVLAHLPVPTRQFIFNVFGGLETRPEQDVAV
jgi:hypothetical protein